MNNDIPTKEILNERFSQLPEVIQDIILESNWKDVIMRIIKKYNLHVDQGGELEALTILTMTGLEESDDYIENIKENLKITDSLAKEITKEIEIEIFQKIREEIVRKTTYDNNGEVKILKEEKKADPYREQTDNVDIIEDHYKQKAREEAQDRLDLVANIDLLENQPKKKGDEIVDRDSLLREVEGDDVVNESDSEIPKADTDLQADIDADNKKITSINTELEKPKTVIEPVHMRTLKSDLIKKKKESPGWIPRIAKKDVVSKKTKEIIDGVEKESNNETK